MTRTASQLLMLFFLLVISGSFNPAFAEDGITAEKIIIGQSCALKGPAQALGLGMRNGALTFFKYINSIGGIKGKQIELISLDDGYEPDACVKNTQQLIEKEKVFMLFGYVGTPTSKAVFEQIKKTGIPYFAPFTGAEFLRNPVVPEIFNIRASYYQETEAMVASLFKKNLQRISVFYQDDSYGMAGLKGVELALQRRNMKILNKGKYQRNTLEVGEAVKIISITEPDAVIMIGAYKPCAEFIRIMRDTTNSRPVFLNVSFVGADALAQTLANKGLGVVISQVMPYPFDKRISVVKEYHQLTEKFMKDVEINFMGMEGFIAAKTLCAILNKVPDFTRKDFIETAESMKLKADKGDIKEENLGGINIHFSPDNHQGSSLVHFSQIGPGGFISNIYSLDDLYKYWD